MPKKTKHPDQQASITLQAPLSRKDALEKLAYQLGLRRLVDGKEQGNVSLVINLLVVFVFEHKDLFAEWIKSRANSALTEKTTGDSAFFW